MNQEENQDGKKWGELSKSQMRDRCSLNPLLPGGSYARPCRSSVSLGTVPAGGTSHLTRSVGSFNRGNRERLCHLLCDLARSKVNTGCSVILFLPLDGLDWIWTITVRTILPLDHKGTGVHPEFPFRNRSEWCYKLQAQPSLERTEAGIME